jgi:hypothetical protein
LHSNVSINRTNYFRILALASVDILLTLPFGILSVTEELITEINVLPSGYKYPMYFGWGLIHSDWAPFSFPYSAQVEGGSWSIFQFYFTNWTSPFLAFLLFALFGLASEARTTYWRGICAIGKVFGWTPVVRKQDSIGEIQFGAPHITMTEQYVFFFLRRTQEVIAHFRRSCLSFAASAIGAADLEQRYVSYPSRGGCSTSAF